MGKNKKVYRYFMHGKEISYERFLQILRINNHYTQLLMDYPDMDPEIRKV